MVIIKLCLLPNNDIIPVYQSYINLIQFNVENTIVTLT